jgi:hypothetical protein
VSIGDTLTAEREQAGLTVTQVSRQTRIRETIIRGIEHDDFSACGGDFYARGHIRSLARAAGADPEPLIREYDQLHGAPQSVTATDVFEPSTPIRMTQRRGPNWAAAMALALALIVGFAVYHLVTSGGGDARNAAAAGPAPASTHPATSAPSPAAHPARHRVIIRVAATDACWVLLTTHSGKLIFNGVLQPGVAHRWVLHRQVSLRLGNPGGVVLTVNGHRRGQHAAQAGGPVTLSFGPSRRPA